jgi:endogenous inhibitor of DNA gyrase (YacG/DUF329 family)
MVYNGYRVYGPYYRKDGRQHVVLHKIANHLDKTTVSYPKYIMEMHLGKYLKPNEVVHHRNGDFTDNSISNLMITTKSEHPGLHRKYDPIVLKCVNCKKDVSLTSLQHRRFQSNQRNKKTVGPFCSKRCVGIFGKNMQIIGAHR